MLKFNEFLNETPSQPNMEVLSLIAKGFIPLTTILMNRLGYSEDGFVAFHATTISHMQDMKDLENSSKAISTFTFGLSSIVKNIVTMPDVILKLQGNALIQSNRDVYSELDSGGRRYITITSDEGKFISTTIIQQVIKFLNENEENVQDDINTKDLIIVLESLSGLLKKRLLFWYFKMVEKILNNTTYTKIISSYLKSESKHYKHNEIILNKFRIIGVYSIEAGAYEFRNESARETIESIGLDYLGHVSKPDFGKVTPDNY